MKESKYTTEYAYLKGFLKASNFDKSIKALSLMYKLHKGQMRKDGITPYYAHPVRVANHLLNLFGHIGNQVQAYFENCKLDEMIAAALLHDVIEDYHDSHFDVKNEIESICGSEVLRLVQILTKTKDISNSIYYNDISKDVCAALIKGADRCHNVSSMVGVFSKDKIVEYIKETKEYVLPLLRYIRDMYPKYSEKVILINYHIKSVLEAIDIMVSHEEVK